MTEPTATHNRGALEKATAISWRFLVIVAALILLGYILARLELIVMPVLLAFLIAVVVTPGAAWAARHGLGRTLGALLIYLAVLGVAAAFVAVFAPRFLDQLSSLGDTLGRSVDELRAWLISGLGLPRGAVDDVFAQVQRQLVGEQGILRTGIVSGATTVGKVLAAAVLTVILSLFFVKDGARMWSWTLSMLPAARRDDVDALGRRAWQVLGRYLLGSGVNGAIEGSIIGVALLILGTPLVLPLAVLHFVAAFFPIVGAVLAGTIAVLITLAATDLTRALILAGVIILVQQLEGNVLAPLILGGAVRLHPVVVIVVLTTGGILGGVIGAFVAVPVTAVSWGIVKELVRRQAIEPPGDLEPLTDEEDRLGGRAGDRAPPAEGRERGAGSGDPGSGKGVD